MKPGSTLQSILAGSAAALLVLTVMWGAVWLKQRYQAQNPQPLIVEEVQHTHPAQ